MNTISVKAGHPCCNYIADIEYARRFGKEIGRPLFSANMSLRIQILQPAKAVKAVSGESALVPVVIFVSGGGFRYPMVKVRVPWLARLAEMGFLVAMPDYRGTEHSPFPAMAEDVISAIRFMRIHAKEYGGDPNKIVLLGGSAGAHISLLAAYSEGRFSNPNDDLSISTSVSGVIDLYGPIDPFLNGNHLAAQLSHMQEEKAMQEYLEPARILKYISKEKKLPPTMILHGDADELVPINQSEILYKALIEAGKDVDFYVIKDAVHADVRFFEPEVNELYAEFIRRVTV